MSAEGAGPRLQRWALLVEYHGAGFCGWQRQENGLSAQEVLEAAAARLEGRPVASIVAGRTDAGVHAAGQVAHIDLARAMAPASLAAALTFHMQPHAIVVRAAAPVDAAFNARFSARRRCYEYTIINRPTRPALAAGLAWHIKRPLDTAAMQQAADRLLGKHDFSSFRAAACQAAQPVRTLDKLAVRREGERLAIAVEARSFLHHQVRIMVGTLALVGTGSWTPARVSEVLAAADRRQAGPTAPACGLTLMGVGYDVDPFGARGGSV